MAVDLVQFAASAPKLAEAMIEANAGYASVGACAVDDGPVVALVIIVTGEHECSEIKAVCEAVSDHWDEGEEE